MQTILLSTVFLLLAACTGVPEGIEPIEDFNIDRYLGKWYEIARLDHSFEKGLSNVTAYFVDDESKGHLKVSFFGPFYGSYVIFGLDKINYQYAFITSHKKEYLWLLARTPVVSDIVMKDFMEASKNSGFNTKEIILVEHDLHNKQLKGIMKNNEQ
jgi:apolipoprotein D and lipocalin family protein